ncbi:MAG: hypothetical protein CMG70_01835 [Candidatus Marinimicrobia bacterium]|nr:hypothetical protein [Candidatus Neomarinimicrobiota bacterium]
MTKFDLLLFAALFWNIYQLVFKGVKKKQFDTLLLIAFISHILFEGIRWQVYPAYLLTLCLWFIKNAISKLIKSFIMVAAVIAIILPVIIPIISFPDPNGAYDIGSVIHHWVDQDREEWFTPENPNDKRQFMLQIWYPGIDDNTEKLPYLDHLRTRAKTIGAAGSFPSFLAMHLDLIKTNSALNLSIDPVGAPFPIVIISHGITGMRQLHTTLAEKLASNGYAVFALDHTYDANITVFPDGTVADYRSEITGHPDSVAIRKQQIETRVADLQFIIDQLERIQSGALRHPLNGYLDLNRIGVTGHSFGGSTVTLAAEYDERIKVVSAIDSWMNPIPKSVIDQGLLKPFLYMGRPSWIDSDYPSSVSYSEIMHQNNDGPSHHITIKGTRHLNYCDAPLFSPIGKYLVEIGDINRKRSVMLVNQLSLEFFDKYLQDKPSAILEGDTVIPEFIIR